MGVLVSILGQIRPREGPNKLTGLFGHSARLAVALLAPPRVYMALSTLIPTNTLIVRDGTRTTNGMFARVEEEHSS